MSEIYISQSQDVAEFETRRFPDLPDFRQPQPIADVISECVDAGLSPDDIEFDEYQLVNYNNFNGDASGWTASTWKNLDTILAESLNNGLDYDAIFNAADEYGETWDTIVESYHFKKYDSIEQYAQLLHDDYDDLPISLNDPSEYVYEVFAWFSDGFYSDTDVVVVENKKLLP